MAKIQHIAILARDTKELATFYNEVFGLEIVGETNDSYWLTDGYVNFAILPHKAMDRRFMSVGLNHFGITIAPDEVDGVYDRMQKYGITPLPPLPDGVDRPYAEDQFVDPQGNHVDLSTTRVKADAKGEIELKQRRTVSA